MLSVYQALHPWCGSFCFFGDWYATHCPPKAAFAQPAIASEWHVSTEVTVLGVSLFTIGLGAGPFLVGAIAELVGQRPIYLGSYFLLWVFTWPVAFTHSIGMLVLSHCLASQYRC